MSWMAKRRMMVQIIPRVIFTLPSTISAKTYTTHRNIVLNMAIDETYKYHNQTFHS